MKENCIISVIIPMLNESKYITNTLNSLQPIKDIGGEIIIVDGGSQDNSIELAKPLSDQLLVSAPGRAKQMNVGAANAIGQVFLFLHADTIVPESLVKQLLYFKSHDRFWGFFKMQLSAPGKLYSIISFFINIRSTMTNVATGDQGIFVSKSMFLEIGGFQDIPLMEDVAISKSLRKLSAPFVSQMKLITSSRRWERKGLWRTILLMWVLRLAYFFGAKPSRLVQYYRRY